MSASNTQQPDSTPVSPAIPPRNAPPSPSRVRLVRPSFYRGELTGSLPPDVRDLLFGLTTLADDEGYLLWRPAEIGAALYAYESSGRRQRGLERRAARLRLDGLLVVHDCGCAFLPSLKEHHAVKGGEKSTAIWAWHTRHSVALRSPTETSVSESVSGSSSSSDSERASSSSRAPGPTPLMERLGPVDGLCIDCRRPTSDHARNCPVRVNPHLERAV